MTRKTLLFLLAGVALGLCIALWGTKSVAVAQSEGKKTNGTARTPPDIEEGVRVRFASQRLSANFTGERESPVVVRVEGNWVYLKGDMYTEQVKLTEAWVNFEQVSWYMVVSR